METLRLTKSIKELINKFKGEIHGKNCKNVEFKNQLFAYLNSRNKKVLRKDVIRWCKNHPWILEDDEELSYHPRKRINLPNSASTSYGGRIRRGRDSRVDEGNLPTTVCNETNETTSFKREVQTPRTSADNQGGSHLPSEIRQSSGNVIGQLGYNSDESTVTVYRGQEGEIVRQSGLPLTQSLNEGDNDRNGLPLRIIRPVAIYACPLTQPFALTVTAPLDQVGAPLDPDSSGRMPSLSPQVPVPPPMSQQPPPSSVRNQPHMDQEKPSCSRNANFNQPPPDQLNSDYDSSYLKSFHDAFVSVRSLTDLCVTCPYLRPGLLPLEEFTDLLSRINKKIAMPKTYAEALRAQLKQIKQERIDSHLNHGNDNDTGTEDETEDTVIETGRVTTTARNLFRKEIRYHHLPPPLINLEDP